MTVAATATGEVVGGVMAQAVADAGADGLLVLEESTPEGRLLMDWAGKALGAGRVHTAPADTPDIDWMRRWRDDPVVQSEVRRAAARVLARRHNWLLAHPANKTELLLAAEMPPERLLPLGDLYAGQVRAIAGSCTLSADVAALVEQAGGIDFVDGALGAWLEGRNDLEAALSNLPPVARDMIRSRLARNRSARRWPRIVPKLGSRTLWVDLFA